MVDMYQSNHGEFSFSNESDLLVHLYTHSDDGTSIHILLYSFHIKVSSGRRFRTYNENILINVGIGEEFYTEK